MSEKKTLLGFFTGSLDGMSLMANFSRFVALLLSLLAVLTIFLVLTGLASAQEILPFNEVRPGMKCYGLTVFQGTEPERFECEVLETFNGAPGFLKGAGFKSIVVRLSGGPVNAKNIGIIDEANAIQGMSGSPIYTLDGKIIGSVLAHFPSTKTPLEFLMPIELTLNFHPAIMDAPNPWLEGSGNTFRDFTKQSPNLPSLKAGEAFAACEVWGDESECHSATVIFADPKTNTVYLTGHDLSGMDRGLAAIPIFKAKVGFVEPNLVNSKKMSKAIGEPIGTMVFNSPFGGVGKLGVLPRFFQVDISLEGVFAGRAKSNRYNLAYTSGMVPNIYGLINGNLMLVDGSLDVSAVTAISVGGLQPIISFGKLDLPNMGRMIELVIGENLNPVLRNVSVTLLASQKYKKAKIKSVAYSSAAAEKSTPPNKIKGNVSVSMLGDDSRFINEFVQEFDRGDIGKTFYISNGETVAEQVFKTSLTSKEKIFLLNHLSDRNSLYLYHYQEDKNQGDDSGIPVIPLSFDGSKDSTGLILDGKNDSKIVAKGTQTVEGKKAGEWQILPDAAQPDFKILRTITLPPGYYVDGKQSFVLSDNGKGKEEKKKKRMWLF
ncbi:MAG: hypothetical protein HY506_01220 [Candidatus Yanofskybacteria bacterium]|nr:hypothetical protein [Candidatus Yanofskybacteria bacterium]